MEERADDVAQVDRHRPALYGVNDKLQPQRQMVEVEEGLATAAEQAGRW